MWKVRGTLVQNHYFNTAVEKPLLVGRLTCLRQHAHWVYMDLNPKRLSSLSVVRIISA